MVRCGSKAAAKKTPATTKAASKKAEKAEIAAVQAKFKDTREKEQAHQSQVDARISTAKRAVLTARRLAATAAGIKIPHGEAPPAIRGDVAKYARANSITYDQLKVAMRSPHDYKPRQPRGRPAAFK